MSSYFEQRMAELKATPPAPRYRLLAVDAKRAKEPAPVISPGKKGHIYFIQAGEHVKIGFATNLASRLQSLSTGNHLEMDHQESFLSYQAAERMLHKRFEKDRVRGEWFRFSDDIEEFMEDLTDYRGSHATGGPDGVSYLKSFRDVFFPLDHVQKILDYLHEPWPEGLFAA